ncbi:hypothetical protein L6452_44427 [Arctium lappa]|uniref:Uncharacterized protein n=1 Tax=Arctium lappa TaxID=4217 RepID=A0ACB8XG59_ARCLA|nr:hypothetical protein L6452_44427 [Arctium lappa]
MLLLIPILLWRCGIEDSSANLRTLAIRPLKPFITSSSMCILTIKTKPSHFSNTTSSSGVGLMHSTLQVGEDNVHYFSCIFVKEVVYDKLS